MAPWCMGEGQARGPTCSLGPLYADRDKWRYPFNAGMRYPSSRPGSVIVARIQSAPPEIYRASAGHVSIVATPGPTDEREIREPLRYRSREQRN